MKIVGTYTEIKFPIRGQHLIEVNLKHVIIKRKDKNKGIAKRGNDKMSRQCFNNYLNKCQLNFEYHERSQVETFTACLPSHEKFYLLLLA